MRLGAHMIHKGICKRHFLKLERQLGMVALLCLSVVPAANGESIGFVAAADSESGFTFKAIPAPVGAVFANPIGINDHGQIVGQAVGTNGGFLYSGGAFTELIDGFVPLGINDNGLMVGQLTQACITCPYGSFLPDGTVVTTISVPGSVGSNANGINDSGAIVGASTAHIGGNYITTGYVESGGAYVTVAPFGSTYSGVTGINNIGDIVGFFDDANGSHGYLYSGGTFTAIDVPGATSTSLLGINDHGQMVGNYRDSTGNMHAFLDDSGSFTIIDFTGLSGEITDVKTFVTGINNEGQIVGTADYTQVPEPSTFALLGVGLIAFICTCHARLQRVAAQGTRPNARWS